MSITNLSRGGDDFRAAAGLARTPASELGPAPEGIPDLRGPGLFEVVQANGRRAVTNVRRLAGSERTPGSRLILAATALLALLAAGLFVVSLAAQYRYVFAVKHQSVPSAIEAVGLDVGMAVFSLLALGLAMAGQSARIERGLIVVCAVASAGQNYAAADVTSPRSVAAYIVPPLFLAVVVDRVVASAGLRRVVLLATPLPEAAGHGPVPLTSADTSALESVIEPAAVTEPPELNGATKKARLTWWYERDAAYGDRAAVAAAAGRIAPKVGLSEGTARAYIGAIVARPEQAGAAS